MATHTVILTESLRYEIEVDAKDQDEAILLAEEQMNGYENAVDSSHTLQAVTEHKD